MLRLIKVLPSMWDTISPNFKDKTDFLTILAKKPHTVPKNLWNNKDFCKKSLFYSPDALEYAKKFQNDYFWVRRCVVRKGITLKYASTELQNDENLALLAINQDTKAYHCLSDKLKDSQKVVIATLKRDGKMIHEMREKIRTSPGFSLTAIRQNPNIKNIYIAHMTLMTNT